MRTQEKLLILSIAAGLLFLASTLLLMEIFIPQSLYIGQYLNSVALSLGNMGWIVALAGALVGLHFSNSVKTTFSTMLNGLTGMIIIFISFITLSTIWNPLFIASALIGLIILDAAINIHITGKAGKLLRKI